MKLDTITRTTRGLEQPLKFLVRPGTSDIKAVREVVERRGYARAGSTPRPGEHWLDLGANIGAFAVWAAAHGATGVAWEPEPEMAELTERNLALNGYGSAFEVRCAAVTAGGPTTATLSVNSARGNVWRSSIIKDWRGSEHVEVPCEDIAPWWTPDARAKIDIEGMEMPILEAYGARRLARLVFEWSFDIDPSLPRFRSVVATLRDTYDMVAGVPSCTVTGEIWQPSWYPPCATIVAA